jgi:hypothetical protein
MLLELDKINKKQIVLMNEMKNETCDDIHSIIRSKQFAESIIELEIKKQLLIDLISKNK